jgi:cytochrome c553
MARSPDVLLIARSTWRRASAGVLALSTAVVAMASSAQSAITHEGMTERVQACISCHGKEGRTINQEYLPRIAGKPAGYLFNQLLNFRDGRRSNPAMTHLLQPLSDAYLREIAEYFSALELPYPAPQKAVVSIAVLSRGEALVLRGDASRKLPACAACHGLPLTGVTPAIPGLLGLPSAYLSAQLGAWRAGQRRAQTPDCMAAVAKALSPEDVSAVAAWLSAQPMPTPAKPIAKLDAPLPLRCGGVPQ